MAESDRRTERNFTMDKPVLSWFAVAVLLSGSAYLASAAEPTLPNQPAEMATVGADGPKLPFCRAAEMEIR